MLWFIAISLNQSQSSWAALSSGKSHGAAAKQPLEGTCFDGTCTFKSRFSRATENSDWTDSLPSCLDLPCRDLRSS